ncbi:MAG: hypothetical protein ACP5UN_01880 [Candidatus Micrarchaeia archaeon]
MQNKNVKYFFKSLIKKAEDPIIAIIFLLVFMMLLYYFDLNLWTIFVIMVLTFLISGTISNYITKSSDIPLIGEKINAKGHAYLLFMLYIIIGTIISGFIAEDITKSVSNYNMLYVLSINLLVIFLSYAYFHFFFYKNTS